MAKIDDKIMRRALWKNQYRELALKIRVMADMIGGDHYDNKTAEKKLNDIAEEMENLNADVAIFIFNVHRRMLDIMGMTEWDINIIRSGADQEERNKEHDNA